MTFYQLIYQSLAAKSLKKLVAAKPTDQTLKKCTATLMRLRGEVVLQAETLTADGKALHKNYPLTEESDLKAAAEAMAAQFIGEGALYRQGNLIDAWGEAELRVSDKGKISLRNGIKPTADRNGGKAAEPSGGPLTKEALPYIPDHDRKKAHILDENTSYDFLIELGVADRNGRINDRKRAKFRQINRFLEILSDVYDKLPREGTLSVCDLCCGKSYLTFAVYYYLTAIKGRDVEMLGIDRKSDVIALCGDIAQKLGYSGLRFIAGDIGDYQPDRAPDLVVSLHACDIATDIVLGNAVRFGAGVILSTPCCHHEMMGQMDCGALNFIERHSILKQKLCDAATDALRALRLEAEGYKVAAFELIDPDETPKNVMLRAVKSCVSEKVRAEKLAEYEAACRMLGVEPYLDRLLKQQGENA